MFIYVWLFLENIEESKKMCYKILKENYSRLKLKCFEKRRRQQSLNLGKSEFKVKEAKNEMN